MELAMLHKTSTESKLCVTSCQEISLAQVAKKHEISRASACRIMNQLAKDRVPITDARAKD